MRDCGETVIIGGGQAGLAMSYYLCRSGREHIVLERGRLAERWRRERWKSLAFQFPNWMMRLPGYSYAGADPDGFTEREGVVKFISQYATHFSPPLRCGTAVTRYVARTRHSLRVAGASPFRRLRTPLSNQRIVHYDDERASLGGKPPAGRTQQQ